MLDIGVLNLKTAVDMAGIEQARGSFVGLSDVVGTVGKAMQGDLTSIAELAIAAAKSMIDFAKETVNMYAEVDKTMRLTYETMGASAQEQEALFGTMKDAAKSSVYTMDDAATATLNFARAGLDATQAANALAPAMHLAAGEGGNLDTVSQGLVGTINGFQDSFASTAHYADVMAAACNNSALDINSLSQSISVAAPVFKTAGYSIEDLSLAMGLMGNNGIQANKAANSLKSGIGLLVRPSNDAAGKMEELGISVTDAQGNMKPFEELLGNLREAFANLTEEEQINAAALIFGKNQYSPWLALINSSVDTVNDLSASLHDCAGTADEMAEAMMEGIGGKMEQLNSTLDVAKVSWGEFFSMGILPLMDPLIKLAELFGNVGEALTNTAKALDSTESIFFNFGESASTSFAKVKESSEKSYASVDATYKAMLNVWRDFQVGKATYGELEVAVNKYNEVSGNTVKILDKERGTLSQTVTEMNKFNKELEKQIVLELMEEKIADINAKIEKQEKKRLETEEKRFEIETELNKLSQETIELQEQEAALREQDANLNADQIAYIQQEIAAREERTRVLTDEAESYGMTIQRYTDKIEVLNGKQEEQMDFFKEYAKQLGFTEEEIAELTGDTTKLTNATEDNSEAVKELTNSYDALAPAVSTLVDHVDWASEEFETLVEDLYEGQDAILEYSDSVDTTTASIDKLLEEQEKQLQFMFDNAVAYQNVTDSLEEYTLKMGMGEADRANLLLWLEDSGILTNENAQAWDNLLQEDPTEWSNKMATALDLYSRKLDATLIASEATSDYMITSNQELANSVSESTKQMILNWDKIPASVQKDWMETNGYTQAGVEELRGLLESASSEISSAPVMTEEAWEHMPSSAREAFAKAHDTTTTEISALIDELGELPKGFESMAKGIEDAGVPETVQHIMGDSSDFMVEGEQKIQQKTEETSEDFKLTGEAIKNSKIKENTKDQMDGTVQAMASAVPKITDYANQIAEQWKKISDAASSAKNNMPQFKTGINFVTQDGLIAQLHYGERVLSRSENEAYTRGLISQSTQSNGDIYNFYIPENSNPMDTALAIRDIMRDEEFSYS